MNDAETNELSEVFVTVPSHDHGLFIEKCLRSIIDQTHPPTKLLVIDDGSLDGSPAVIERILRDCPFESELIVRENRGLCATLNQALSLSCGKYFAYIGSDDYWFPEFLAARTALLNKREKAVLAYGNAYFIDENGGFLISTADSDDSWGNYVDGDAREMLLSVEVPISSTVFYRRSALDGLEWNENAKLEDFEFYIRLMTRGEFAFDPSVLAVWRKHANNTSRDLLFMLNEVLAIQERNMDSLGISKEQLDELQTATRFKYARDLLQNGEKFESIRLARRNWRGVRSNAELLNYALRLALPMSFVNRKRHQKRKNHPAILIA